MKYVLVFALVLLITFYVSAKALSKTDLPKDTIKAEAKELSTAYGPSHITRTIKQDRKGNIWIGTFGGVFRYDGKTFTNVTRQVSSARFFSVLEDRKGNFWFSTVGEGVYYYDGKSFRNYRLNEGLLGLFSKDDNDVNSIIEDKTGKFWFATRGNAYTHDGKTFTVLTHDGIPFVNVRTIIEDKKGGIWLGGQYGLWRYDGHSFTNFSKRGVAYVYEDKKGNIWTSSLTSWGWSLFRYDGETLSNKTPTLTELELDFDDTKGMLFGILEASDGSIWFGSGGAYRYDGKSITNFKK